LQVSDIMIWVGHGEGVAISGVLKKRGILITTEHHKAVVILQKL